MYDQTYQLDIPVKFHTEKKGGQMPEIENSGKTTKSQNENDEEGNESGILSALVRELRREFGPVLEKIKVEDVRIGLAYTGVLLSENYGGVACTPLYEFSGCPALDFSEILKGKTAGKILELTLSKNPLEAVVGIATVNALSNMLRDLKPENFPASDIDILVS